MARRRISILESFLSGGNVGSRRRRSANATLKASTRTRSRVACAVRYFCVARRRRRRSSRDSGTDSAPSLRSLKAPILPIRELIFFRLKQLFLIAMSITNKLSRRGSCHKRQKPKAPREKSQTPKVLTATLTLPDLT